MNFLELAKDRYSVRSYKPDMIEEEKLAYILEAGRLSPTACNFQPQKIFVIKKAEILEKLNTVCRFTFGAPVVLVIGYDTERDWKNKRAGGIGSGETDAAIVTTHMMLAAWEQGIGSCWVGAFSPDKVSEALGISENIRITALMPLGYPSSDAEPMSLHSEFRDYSDTIEFLDTVE
jgi:nitroreductase